MSTTVTDFKISSLAAGFTLGFGFLTCWTAIKQTRRANSPLKSIYLWMVWGEIIANLGIGVLGYLLLEGIIPVAVSVLFWTVLFWVFEIQLLMQIIINRVYVVADDKQQVVKVKWATALIITIINIMVGCIFIPAQLDPPPTEMWVMVNKYWDPTSKALVCVVDAALNVWFVRTVRQRLVRYHHLTKYNALVQFNSWLIVVSVGMDVILIGIMFVNNKLVFLQFHPVTYMVKLNIEMSLASLIAKLARRPIIEPGFNEYTGSHTRTSHSIGRYNTPGVGMSVGRANPSFGHEREILRRDDSHMASMGYGKNGNIHAKTDIFVERGRYRPS